MHNVVFHYIRRSSYYYVKGKSKGLGIYTLNNGLNVRGLFCHCCVHGGVERHIKKMESIL